MIDTPLSIQKSDMYRRGSGGQSTLTLRSKIKHYPHSQGEKMLPSQVPPRFSRFLSPPSPPEGNFFLPTHIPAQRKLLLSTPSAHPREEIFCVENKSPPSPPSQKFLNPPSHRISQQITPQEISYLTPPLSPSENCTFLPPLLPPLFR